MAETITLPYKAMAWQDLVSKQLKRFNVLIVARGQGKTYFTCGEAVTRALQTPSYKIIMLAPTKDQGERISWENLTEFSIKVPGVEILKSEREIKFANGSSIILLGAKNYQGIRGHHVNLIIVDETEDIPEDAWQTVLRPAVARKNGSVIFIGTPRGEGFLASLYHLGQTQDDWYTVLLTAKDLKILSDDELEKMKIVMGETKFNQEMMCSFIVPTKGAHFSHQIARAYESGRVRPVAIDPFLGVYTGWDIGYDGTVVWFAQIINNQVNIIDVKIFEDKDLRHVCNELGKLPYVILKDFIPHDARQRSKLDRTKTVEGALKAMGRKTYIVPKSSLMNGIEVARVLIDTAIFNSNLVTNGIKALKQYRSEYDEGKKVTSKTVVHDDNSHVADAFRYLALGLKLPKEGQIDDERQIKIKTTFNPFNINQSPEINNSWDIYKS